MSADSDNYTVQEGLRGWTIPGLLVGATSVSILSTDLYTPSLAHLPELLGTDASTAQLTMSMNFAAYALSPLLLGPLADRIGHRRLLLWGFAGVIATSLACALSSTIGALIAARFLQGLFASVPSVVVALVIRSLYSGAQAVRIFSAYGMAIGVAPALGPLIGGHVYVAFGWQANFVLLAAIAALVLLGIALLLPETGRPGRSRVSLKDAVSAYAALLAKPAYLRFMLPMACGFGAFFAFITAGPFVLIDQLGVDTEDYGYCYALMIAAFVCGSLVANRLASHITMRSQVEAAVLIMLLAACTMVFGRTVAGDGLAIILAPMAAVAFAQGMLLPGGTTLMLDATGSPPSGYASALSAAMQSTAIALASFMVGALHDDTGFPLALTVAVFCVLASLSYATLTRMR